MLQLKRYKKPLFFFFLLFLVFLSINSRTVWKFMYPIKYEKQIKIYTSKFHVDPYLVLAIIQVETRFQKDKHSPKGAVGLMQIMPETANWIAKRAEFPSEMVQNLHQPENNIAFGSWYLSKMNQQFNGNIYATIAAYNAGPGNVEKWIQQGLWDGSLEHLDRIPFGETRHYVQRVLHFYDRYQWIYKYDF
ncbi:lytic transglycosylase domain-containing protein [Tepidibacillus fermentans]|uniref:Soluble lytic murein transglycosylase n=1 Tax=Tepidibacillus fermentans TaxID=1281767 RepID=A0A4R3KL97_9BACI|nr:lytic transglycosylase domain-containing protein [Tepidibacillus fermentans]TCS83560.1 soluble lytic murein transglycosylase [Tepidibacillus fermentans]